jgi:hypothetical protein
MDEVSKKTSIILILLGVVLALTATLYLIDFIQNQGIPYNDGLSDNSGTVSLTFEKPIITKDQGSGGVSLTLV